MEAVPWEGEQGHIPPSYPWGWIPERSPSTASCPPSLQARGGGGWRLSGLQACTLGAHCPACSGQNVLGCAVPVLATLSLTYLAWGLRLLRASWEDETRGWQDRGLPHSGGCLPPPCALAAPKGWG